MAENVKQGAYNRPPNMRRKNTTQIRAYPEDRDKIERARLEVAAREGREVRTAEFVRRMVKAANKETFLIDAEIKRRLRKR